MKFFIPLAFCLLLWGCVKRHDCGCVMPYQIYYLRARVVQTSDVSCGLPVLDFSEDSTRIRMTTNLDNVDYAVIQLPPAATVLNKMLYVSVALLKPEEQFTCNALGINYPRVKIMDWKDRN
jgi:hypothetical protein